MVKHQNYCWYFSSLDIFVFFDNVLNKYVQLVRWEEKFENHR